MKYANGKSALILYYDWYEQFLTLSNEERGQLLLDIYRYDIYGKEPDYSNSRHLAMFFCQIKQALDYDSYKYAMSKKRNQEIIKRYEEENEEY